MNKISDKRLNELLDWWPTLTQENSDVASALRELLAYRKAVREYLGALDAPVIEEQKPARALANLRALAQPEEKP